MITPLFLNKTHWPALFSFRWGQLLILLLFWGLLVPAAFGQTKVWDKTLGGSKRDLLHALQQTTDGGYILGGYSDSDCSGSKSENSRGSDDYWVVKLDADGHKQWDKTYGGSDGDYLSALQQTSDGGFILGGWSISDKSGDKSEEQKPGFSDFWVVKLDAAGNKQWDKSLGGDKFEGISALQQTRDGGYILGGYSTSGISGDKSEANRGSCLNSFCTLDFWVVKLDAAGNKQWDKTLGGAESDGIAALQQTSDGGYILGGISASGVGGDKTSSRRGNVDYWVVKLDASGNKTWDKSFGGNGVDDLSALQQTSDGGYILGGSSTSDANGDKTEANRFACAPNLCTYDYWVVKLDAAGNKTWDKTFGGNGVDDLSALRQTGEGGYILGGSSESDISGDKTGERRGEGFDYWVVKLDAAGNKAWDRTYGAQETDDLTALQQTSDGNYILGGSSRSGAGGDKSGANRGNCVTPSRCQHDFWVLKIQDDLAPRIASFSPKKDVPGSVVTFRGQGFLTTGTVRFNGLDAAFEVVSDNEVKATVPVNATTGKIVLSNAAGVAVSPGSFRVRHPGITAFSPGEGPVGTTVYLEGDRLTTAKEVFFGGVQAREVRVLSDSTMTVVVPGGAVKGRIKVVLAGGGYGNSKTKFVVTPAPAEVRTEQKPARKAIGAQEPGALAEPRIAAFPNPFRQQVTFSFSLPKAQPVVVKVYDLLGREVQEIYRGAVEARQACQAEWRPQAQQSTGLYIIRLEAPGQVSQQKVLLAR